MNPQALFVGSLYRSALVIETERFRSWALTRLGTVLDYDAIIWATGAADGDRYRVHDISVIGVSDEMAAGFVNPGVNEFFVSSLSNYGRALRSDAWRKKQPDARWLPGDAGFDVGIAVNQRRALSGLVSVLQLYRRGDTRPFSEAEASVLEQLAFHLDDAGSLSFFVHLGQPPKIPRRKFAAVCDRHGVLREVQERFLELLKSHYPEWSGPQLPFDVPEPANGEIRLDNGLYMQAESVGDWLCLRIWEAGPLDKLSDREREVVTATCQGLTLKETAKRFGIAPSTASNHLYRAYDKLDVGNREELRAVVKPVTFT